jgi:putative tryptophan/tyrosine transport system substrate-binding protein
LSRSLLLVAIALSLIFAPLAAWTEQRSGPYIIGLMSFSASLDDPAYRAFRERLRELGQVEGQTVKIEFRNAEGHVERLPNLADELVHLPADVIVVGNPPAARAVKRATSSIPIVVSSVDPVAAGMATSYAHPGGNVTGVSSMTAALTGKRLELLKETIPRLKRLAVLFHEYTPSAKKMVEDINAAALSLSIEVKVVKVQTPEEFGDAFAALRRANVQALYIVESPLFYGHRSTLAALALKARLPAMYGTRIFVEDGGLLSYGADMLELSRRVAGYVDKILKGAKPADLPIEQASKLELVINLKMAKSLGLTIPSAIVSRADEIIR